MLPSFCRDVITVKRARLVDKRGTIVQDWTNPQTFELTNCSFQYQTTGTDRDGRTLQITNGAVLYTNYNADVEAGDRVEFRGETYLIEGAPIPVYGATGRISHYEIPLSAWSG